MASQQSSSAGTPPRIPAAEDLYNQLMRTIDTDLTTDNLPTLKEKYPNETPAQAKARGERYVQAFEEYDRQLATYLASLDAEVHTYQRMALASMEKKDQQEEQGKLDDLNSQIAGA